MALESRTEPRYAGRLRRVGARYSASGMEVPDEARRREGRVKQGGNREAFRSRHWITFIRGGGLFHFFAKARMKTEDISQTYW